MCAYVSVCFSPFALVLSIISLDFAAAVGFLLLLQLPLPLPLLLQLKTEINSSARKYATKSEKQSKSSNMYVVGGRLCMRVCVCALLDYFVLKLMLQSIIEERKKPERTSRMNRIRLALYNHSGEE